MNTTAEKIIREEDNEEVIKISYWKDAKTKDNINVEILDNIEYATEYRLQKKKLQLQEQLDNIIAILNSVKKK